MNIIADPAFPVTMIDGRAQVVHLPSLLGHLAAAKVSEYSFLRPHQQAPWHSFLVQLASIALLNARESSIPDQASDWPPLLRALTPDWLADEPWCLVVDDIHRPAFMQPGVPTGDSDPHIHAKATPDDLDVLFTSKNHGIKQNLSIEANAAEWISALVTLQTCGAYTKAGSKLGYFGSVRRNGEYATRPFVGLVPAGGVSRHWRRDVNILLSSVEWYEKNHPDMSFESRNALLWCRQWNGVSQLSEQQLHPWFIEICRRVRLYRDGNHQMLARTVGSTRALIEAKDRRGHIGDPWIPISRGDHPAAFNSLPNYENMSAILFSDSWHRPVSLEWHDGIDQLPMRVRFAVTVRGQGTTAGHHLREVPIDSQERLPFLLSVTERDRIAKIAAGMVKDASALKSPILKSSLITLVKGGTAKVRLDDASGEWIDRWLKFADRRIEEEFFEQLFDIAETGDDHRWSRLLRRLATEVFEAAVRTMPIAGVRRLKAVAVAESRLWSGFKAHLPGHYRDRIEETVDVE